MSYQELREQIKVLRIQKGLSQNELAQLSGVSLRTIQRIENGESKPQGETLRKIVNILECQADIGLLNNKEHLTHGSFIKQLSEKNSYLIILIVFSMLGIYLSATFYFTYFMLVSFVVSFICLFMLCCVSVYQLKHKGYKSAFKMLSLTTFFSLFYIFTLVGMSFSKGTKVYTQNAQRIKVEYNELIGKSDTTVIKKDE